MIISEDDKIPWINTFKISDWLWIIKNTSQSSLKVKTNSFVTSSNSDEIFLIPLIWDAKTIELKVFYWGQIFNSQTTFSVSNNIVWNRTWFEYNWDLWWYTDATRDWIISYTVWSITAWDITISWWNLRITKSWNLSWTYTFIVQIYY